MKLLRYNSNIKQLHSTKIITHQESRPGFIPLSRRSVAYNRTHVCKIFSLLFLYNCNIYIVSIEFIITCTLLGSCAQFFFVKRMNPLIGCATFRETSLLQQHYVSCMETIMSYCTYFG